MEGHGVREEMRSNCQSVYSTVDEAGELGIRSYDLMVGNMSVHIMFLLF